MEAGPQIALAKTSYGTVIDDVQFGHEAASRKVPRFMLLFLGAALLGSAIVGYAYSAQGHYRPPRFTPCIDVECPRRHTR